jgi:proteasome beta subunit
MDYFSPGYVDGDIHGRSVVYRRRVRTTLAGGDMNHSQSEDQQSVASDYRTDGHGPVAGGTLVGLTTEDGVLLAADTRTSRGAVVRSEGVRKISQVHPTAVMGSTDGLGTAQSFVREIRSEADRYETSHDEPMDMTSLSTVAVTELRKRSMPDTTFLLGGVDADGPHLFTLGPDEGALEETYAAVGSGQQIAYGILDAKIPQSLPISEARLIAGRAIQSAAERDVQTDVGVHVAEISDDGVDIHHYESVDDLLDGR